MSICVGGILDPFIVVVKYTLFQFNLVIVVVQLLTPFYIREKNINWFDIIY